MLLLTPPDLLPQRVIEDKGFYGNQVELVKADNNKFYRAQAIQSDSGCFTFFRWGRQGDGAKASSQKLQIFPDAASAGAAFEKQFKSKTGNKWAGSVATYESKVKKYIVVHEAVKVAGGGDGDGGGSSKITYAKPVLKGPLADFVKLVTDQDMFKSQLDKLGIDADKLFAAGIAKKTVDAGYAVLLQIQAELKKARPNADTVGALSGQFYALIPHASPRGSRLPFLTSGNPDKYALRSLLAFLLSSSLASSLASLLSSLLASLLTPTRTAALRTSRPRSRCWP